MPTDSSVPVVRSLELRDINNALNAIRERLRGIASVADTANLKAGQLALTAGQGNGTLITLQQQVAALQSAVTALSAGASGPTAVYRADRAIQANDPVYTTSDGGVSSVDTQDPTAIFAVIGIAVSGAAQGSPITVRRAGVMAIAGADFEVGRAVYAQVGSGLTQHPNYAAVAIPVGVAVGTTSMDVRGAWPALIEEPLYTGGLEDYMPVALALVRQMLDLLEFRLADPVAGLGTPVYATHFGLAPGPIADYPKAGYQVNKTATGHAHYGVLDSTVYDFTGSFDPIIGSASYNDNSSTVGAHVFDHHHSFQSDPHFSQTAAAGVVSSFWSQFDVNITTGSISELSGLKVNNPTGTGSGTVSSFYGVLIGALTRGANNWGVFVTGPTESFFGGVVYLGSSTTPYASIQYEPSLGHLMMTPRAGYNIKIGASSGDQKLRLGDPTVDTYDATIENTSSGDMEITPRSTYKVHVKSSLLVGSGAASDTAEINTTGSGRLEFTPVTGAGATKFNANDVWVVQAGAGFLLTNAAGTITKRVSLSSDGLSLVLS